MRNASSKNRLGKCRMAVAVAVAVMLSCAVAAWCSVRLTTNDVGGLFECSRDQTRDWDESEAPNYYQVVGKAQIDESLPTGEVVYEPLDSLGRASGVSACVDYDLMETGKSRERMPMSDLRPSGWGSNERVTIDLPYGDVYRGYFWNRSHLLAKSLGGEEIIENLVCGTRMQNVGANARGAEGGMAYAESLVRKWLEAHPSGAVQYSARPRYRGLEPVCRDVVVDVLSSDGTIDCEVIVFNAAKGYSIDYATGTFWAL